MPARITTASRIGYLSFVLPDICNLGSSFPRDFDISGVRACLKIHSCHYFRLPLQYSVRQARITAEHKSNNFGSTCPDLDTGMGFEILLWDESMPLFGFAFRTGDVSGIKDPFFSLSAVLSDDGTSVSGVFVTAVFSVSSVELFCVFIPVSFFLLLSYEDGVSLSLPS